MVSFKWNILWPLEPDWPSFPSAVAEWLSHACPHLFCSCGATERGRVFSNIRVAPGLGCSHTAFGARFCKHSGYFRVSPWDFFFPSKEKHSQHSHLHLGIKMGAFSLSLSLGLFFFFQLNKCLLNFYHMTGITLWAIQGPKSELPWSSPSRRLGPSKGDPYRIIK